MINLLKKVSLWSFFSLVLCTSCTERPIYMNSKEGLLDAQRKVLELADGLEIDSLSLRSTSRKSLVSSLFLVLTDDQKQGDEKIVVEFIPSKKIHLKEKSNISQKALHSFKIDLPSLAEPIERAKSMLPTGYIYKDVNRIMYGANILEETYYIALEVTPLNGDEENEYVEKFFAQPDYTVTQVPESGEDVASETYYIVTYSLKNNELKLLK